MVNRQISFNVLDRLYEKYSHEFSEAVHRVLESAWYILGSEVETLRKPLLCFVREKNV